jgi:hypothetical protein
MATGVVKFGGPETPSVDELAGGTPAQLNVLTDAAGATRMRPGISAWTGFPTTSPTSSPVIGISAWNGYVVFVTLDRKIWSLAAGAVTALSSAVATTKLDGGLRPIFATTRTRIIIAGGGKPQKWEGAGLSARLGGSPPAFSHVATIAQRVVGNDSGVSGIIYWSELGDTGAESWRTGLNFREAETRQDPVIGLYENSNELVALGTETIEMLSPDPSETFTKARTIEVGWGPPHSYVQFDQSFMGMDVRKRMIESEGRSFNVFSTPFIGKQLEDIADVSDCWGLRHKFESYDLGVWTFPTDGRSFAYDTVGKNWSEYRGYDSTTGGFGRWKPTTHYFWADQKLRLVGSSDGRINVLDPSATTDLGDPILVQMTSTFEGHKTSRKKHTQHLRFKFRRGIDASGGTNVMLYSYRDDLGAFCEPFRLPIGDPTDVAPVVVIDSPGMPYRVRQHRIVVDSVAFRFAGLEEDFNVLSS